jgi:hypothetical protein
MVENGIVHFDPSLECYAKEVEHLLKPKLLFVSPEVFEERMHELYGDNEGNDGQKVDNVPMKSQRMMNQSGSQMAMMMMTRNKN